MKPELYINGRFLTQQITGVQSFARSVCLELEDQTDFTLLVPANADLVDDAFSKKIRRIGKFKGHLWEQISLPLFLSYHKNNILLNLCNTGSIMLRNQIVTVHDLAFVQDPTWFTASFAGYYSRLIPRIVRKSKAVLTVSTTVKNELLETYGLSSDKISVIGNKINDDLLKVDPVSPATLELRSGKYFLLVGSDDPRKNFSMVERLFEKEFSEYQLVIVGGKQVSFKSSDINADIKNSIRIGYTNPATLSWLYRNSLGLINPSFYEGFGIPNLEAFAFSCPVFCSDIAVFREVCREAAVYFDPKNPESLRQVLSSYLKNPGNLKLKLEQGSRVFKKFQECNRAATILKAVAL